MVHLERLEQELAGRGDRAYRPVATILLIRREVKIQESIPFFFAMWEAHKRELLASLSTRWLVSASDTFADHGRTAAKRAGGLWASLLENVVEAYEVANRLKGWSSDQVVVPDLVENSAQNNPYLFDGVSGLAVKADDSFRNMRWRMYSITRATRAYPERIASEVFERLNLNQIAYQTLRSVHQQKKNRWWNHD